MFVGKSLSYIFVVVVVAIFCCFICLFLLLCMIFCFFFRYRQRECAVRHPGYLLTGGPGSPGSPGGPMTWNQKITICELNFYINYSFKKLRLL